MQYPRLEQSNLLHCQNQAWGQLWPLPQSLSIGPPGSIDRQIIRSAIYDYVDHVLEAAKICRTVVSFSKARTIVVVANPKLLDLMHHFGVDETGEYILLAG